MKFISIFLLLLSSYAYADSTVETNSGTLSFIANETANQKTININQASAEQIAEALHGIGIKKAEAIVAWRKKYGGFKHIQQLTEVKGIGEKTLEKNKDLIRLE